MTDIFSKERSNFVVKAILILTLAPAAAYAYTVFHYALNIPHWDDYDAVLDFMNHFKTSTSLSSKILLLFSQQNEHRILFTKCFFALYYALFHILNFQNAILFNIVLILMVFTILSYFIKKALPESWPFAVLIMSICLFDLNGYENADFAMAGLQNYGIILLFVGSMFFYSKDKKIFLSFACLLQAICVYSSGNGNLASFCLVLFVLFRSYRPAKITAIITFLITAPLYFVGYNRVNQAFTLQPSKFVPYFLHTIAGHFGLNGGIIIGVSMLIALLILSPHLKGKKFNEDRLPLLFITVFILGSCGIISIFRGAFPIDSAVSSRYMVYPNILVGIIFTLLLLKIFQHKTRMIVSFAFIVSLGFVYFRNYHPGDKGFQGFYNLMKNNKYNYPDTNRAKALTDESCRLGIYCIEKERPH